MNSETGNPSKISLSLRSNTNVPTTNDATSARIPMLMGSTVAMTNMAPRTRIAIICDDIIVLFVHSAGPDASVRAGRCESGGRCSGQRRGRGLQRLVVGEDERRVADATRGPRDPDGEQAVAGAHAGRHDPG